MGDMPVAGTYIDKDGEASHFNCRLRSDEISHGDKVVLKSDAEGVKQETIEIAVQVVEEQGKVLSGIADELEARDDVDDHLQDQIELLRHAAEENPKELRKAITKGEEN